MEKKYECKCKGCDRKFDEEEYKITNDQNNCIYHCKKDTWEKEKISEFYIILKKERDKKFRRKHNKTNIFENIYFPKLTIRYIIYIVSEEVESIMFINCKFCSNFSVVNFFCEKELLFINCLFEERVDFNSSIFLKKVLFFNHTKLKKELSLINTTFNDDFIVDKVNFEKINFKYSRFEKSFFFKNVTLNNEIELSRASVILNKEFYNINSDVKDRETARILKYAFEEKGNIIEANKYYQKEMIKRERELEVDIKKRENILEWMIFKIHNLSSNHSQEWVLPLLLILIFGIIYSLCSFSSLTIEKNEELIKAINLHKDSIWQVYLLWFSIFSSVITFFISMFNPKELSYKYLCVVFVLASFYIGLTKDIFFTFFAYNINPFSIMTSKDILTSGTLLFKIIIAYLIYQLIVSIRQNTRRK